jgi:hypothetical protein
VIRPMLPELEGEPSPPALTGEYSSAAATADAAALALLLRPYMTAKGSAELLA